MIGDLRNKLDIELARASGGYLDEVPEGMIGAKWAWLEPKRDDVRISLQFDETKNWAISRNREGKLKGVDKAGPFCNKDQWLPHLCRDLVIPKMAGLMMDGGVSDRKSKVGGRGASVVTLMREDPKRLVYTAWDLIFDVGGKDVRDWTQAKRRELLEKRVGEIGSVHVQTSEVLPATMEEIKRLWGLGWEGGVLKDSMACYRGTRAWIKCKAENPVDAFVINYIPERRGGSPKKGIKPTPTGRATGFMMGMKTKAGKVVCVGPMMMGLPEEDRDRGIKFFDREYRGKVAEIKASGWDGKSFRWMRFFRWHQEQEKACILEEQTASMALVGAEVE